LKFYEKFVDVFPKSKYLKQAEKSYDGANKALEKIAKAELEAKALKEKEKTAAKEAEKLGKN
jgi:outer membrane protein assembly factor BamD